MKTAINCAMLICVALLLLLTVSCTYNYSKKVYDEGKISSLSVSEFAATIASSDVQLVDVRTPDEFANGSIPGSVNIDVLTGHFGETVSASLDKSRTVAVYCRSSNRSKNAAKMLSMMGYNVVELDKGYNAWVEYHNGSK